MQRHEAQARLNHVALMLALGLALGMMLHATGAHAMATVQTLDSPNIMTTTYQNFIAQMNTRINVVLAPGSVWVKWSRVLLLGAFVTALIVSLARYTFAESGVADIGGTLVAGAIITALYSTYNIWTWTIFMGGQEAGILIQSILLNDTGVMGPANYMSQVLTSVKTQNTSWFQLDLMQFVEGFIIMAVEAVMNLAAFFACIWNSMVFAVAKLIGPLVFFSLFHERLSFLFDGWLRFMVFTALYGLVARVCMSVIVLVFEVAFSAPYSGGAGATTATQAIVLSAADFNAFLYLCAICGVSVLMLFASAVFVGRIVGGANIGIGAMIGGAARTVGTAFARAAVA